MSHQTTPETDTKKDKPKGFIGLLMTTAPRVLSQMGTIYSQPPTPEPKKNTLVFRK